MYESKATEAGAQSAAEVKAEAPKAEAPKAEEPKAKKTYKIVMIRHGESAWNKENRFCGWFDADLSDKGNKGIEKLKMSAIIINPNSRCI